MSPTPPSPTDPDAAARAMSILEYSVKLVMGLGALWVGVTKIAKPYTAWRRAHIAELVRDVLAPELQHLAQLRDGDGDVRRMCREILDGQERILNRQDQGFREMDHFHEIATINNDRLDELNLFLDAIGFTSDRRSKSAEAQRKTVDGLLARLRLRKLARDRDDPLSDTDEHPASPPHLLGESPP